jgi:2-dehydropantoate 2-reductase
MTAVTRSTIGVLRDDPALLSMTMGAFDEALAVGRAQGLAFAPSFREETVQLVQKFPASSKSSMLEDLERGRPLELPWLSGTVVAIGREAGVPTPIHGFIATVLGPFVAGRSVSARTP